MKKNIIIFFITLAAGLFAAVCIGYVVHAETQPGWFSYIELLPYYVLTLLLFLHYRKTGVLTEKLHKQYLYYLILVCLLVRTLNAVLNNDHFSDISTIIYNIALTYVALDVCKRQPAKAQWMKYPICALCCITLVGILFIPMPIKIFFTYCVLLIWLYAVVAACIDARRRQWPGREWYYAMFILVGAYFIPAYLIETKESSSLEKQAYPS